MTFAPVVLQQAAIDSIINDVFRFVPRLVWSLVVLVVGVGVAIFVAGRAHDAVESSDRLSDGLAQPVGTGVKVLLYFFAVTIALSELGVAVGVLAIFLDGIAFGLGAGFALAFGIALGWGSKDYVAEHVEEWLEGSEDAVGADDES